MKKSRIKNAKTGKARTEKPRKLNFRFNLKDMKVRKKLMAGFMLASAISLILAAFGFYALTNSDRTSQELEMRVESMPNITNAITDLSMIQSEAVQAALAKTDALETQRQVGEAFTSTQNTAFEVAQKTMQKYDKAFRADAAKVEQSDMPSEWHKRLDNAVTNYKNLFYTDITMALESAKSGNSTIADDNLQQTGSLGQAITTNFTEFMNYKLQESRSKYDAERGQAEVFLFVMVILAVAGIAASVFMGIHISSDIDKPLKELENCSREMSKGNLQVRSTYRSKNEFGVLSSSLNEFFALLQGRIADVSHTLTDLAHGRFDGGPMPEFEGDLRPISESVNQVLKDLNRIFGDIQTAADQVDSGSSQVASGSQALAQGASEQAGTVEELSASIEDVSAKVRQNSESIAEIASAMSAAAGDADTGNGRMKEMLKAMDGISTSSQEIGKIIKVIDNIAFQTNILALNASVEAAHAGEAGKGFAVVAEEVRNLAGKSADAAKQTSQLIGDSAKKVKEGFGLAESTAESLASIAEKVKAMDASIRRIREASNAQAASISQITAGVDQVSKVVQTNSSTAEQSAAASEELSAQAARLKKGIGGISLRAQA